MSPDAPYRPILLDFGLCKELPASVKIAFAKMLIATADVSVHVMTHVWGEAGGDFLVGILAERFSDVVEFVFGDGAAVEG